MKTNLSRTLKQGLYQGRKSVWYDSRYYRIKLFWDKNGIAVRDLHQFDENKISAAHDGPMKSPVSKCETLPVVEPVLWAANGENASTIPVAIGLDGGFSRLNSAAELTVTQTNLTKLKIVQPLEAGATLTIRCAESSVTLSAVDGQRHAFRFALQLKDGAAHAAAVTGLFKKQLQMKSDGFSYTMSLLKSCIKRSPEGILLQADDKGELALQLISD